MKHAMLLFVMLTLGGCASLTPQEKRIYAVIGAIVVVGAIAASSSGSGDDPSDGICVSYSNPPGC